MEEPVGQFHEAFTTTTWQEVAAEAQSDGDNANALDAAAMLESLPGDAGATVQGTTAGETYNSEEIIRPAAYFRYLHRQTTGEPGDALGDWIGAEREVVER